MKSGDPMGRFLVATKFVIQPNAAVNYARTRNADQSSGNLDSEVGGGRNMIEFYMWAYFYPRFQKGITSLMNGVLGEQAGHLTAVDELYTTEWSCKADNAAVGGVTWGEGTIITEEIVESLSQNPSIVTPPTDTNAYVINHSSFYEFKYAPKIIIGKNYLSMVELYLNTKDILLTLQKQLEV